MSAPLVHLADGLGVKCGARGYFQAARLYDEATCPDCRDVRPPRPRYRVTWTVELHETAAYPLHAAKLARKMQLDPNSTATVFEATELIGAPEDEESPWCTGKTWTIDTEGK